MIKNTFCGKFNRPQLIKRWITPIHWIAQLLSLILIGLIMIYAVDSTTFEQGQVFAHISHDTTRFAFNQSYRAGDNTEETHEKYTEEL